MELERTLSPEASGEDEALERAIRPRRLADYVGQPKARAQLEIFIGAARQRAEALDHVLVFGPPGLGKTTLAHIIAAELGVNLRQTSGPVLERLAADAADALAVALCHAHSRQLARLAATCGAGSIGSGSTR